MSDAGVRPGVGPLGILGGTFDPVHRAHLQLAKEAITALALAQVLWIPAGRPPHRAPPLAAAQHRLAMVRLAIAGDAGFALDDSEVRTTGPSYTVNTLERLRSIHGQRPLVLLLGADAFLGLAAWHRWRELFALAHLAVATRPGYTLDAEAMPADLRSEYLARQNSDRLRLAERAAGSIVPFTIRPLEISASAIRAGLGANREMQDLLPGPVLDYIAEHHLYSPSLTR